MGEVDELVGDGDDDAVTSGLMVIRDAVAELAFTRVEASGRGAPGFADIITLIGAAIDDWDGQDNPDGHAVYRLGVLVGSLSYLAGCRVDGDGTLIPLPLAYPQDNPVAVAAERVRDAVLLFPGVPPTEPE